MYEEFFQGNDFDGILEINDRKVNGMGGGSIKIRSQIQRLNTKA